MMRAGFHRAFDIFYAMEGMDAASALIIVSATEQKM